MNTEISPELIPVKPGEVPQSTEKSVGPYELQDFNLFYTLRFGFRPSKIAFLAHHAWATSTGAWPPAFPGARAGRTTSPAIREWLVVFVKRFFGFAQFKRSAMPNGPKVSHGGSLSPRGDWRMPSDAGVARLARRARRQRPEGPEAPLRPRATARATRRPARA